MHSKANRIANAIMGGEVCHIPQLIPTATKNLLNAIKSCLCGYICQIIQKFTTIISMTIYSPMAMNLTIGH